MRAIAQMAAPATAIKDPSRMLPTLLPVDFVGTAAPLGLVPLLPAAEEMDGAGVVAGMELLPSDDVTRMVVVPDELPVEDAETEPVNVAEEAAETETVVEVADAATVVEVADTDAMVADAATEGVQQDRYEVVRTAVPE
jgi:hypothetical protein